MGVHPDAEALESQIDQWRDFVRGRETIGSADVEELEDHLRARIDELLGTGLSADEAFVVAVMRMGNLDEVSKEFARAHSDRLWKQLALVGESPDEDHRAK
ncbi:MAG TPA: permease prefix domain 1-containing protein, partial [Acidimicrobiia bacterium]|nr:permease prefix domain 1-containing protein [Acidimicrobiia bacterium]